VSQHVNLYEAKTRLSQLVERAARGEEIIIAKAGKPMARLVPYRPAGTRRAGQNLLGITFIAEDFDDPMPEIEESFESKA
jgi:prevent-host-death family protein